MNGESTFELTWIQREGRRQPEPCLRFEAFDKVRAANLSYEAALWVCATPRCPCCSVCFSCRPLTPAGTTSLPSRPGEFWLDLADRSLQMSPQLRADSETLALAKVVRKRLTDTDWGQLYQWFRSAKLEVIENADVASIDPVNLPDVDGGRMVGFVDVFPLGLALNFPCENRLWAADDQYCVQSGCNCTETVLSFLQIENANSRRVIPARSVFAVRYNFRSHATSELKAGPAGVPDSGQLLAALKAAHPSLDEQLKLRHRKMQSLYARFSHAETESQRESRPAAPVPVRKVSVGRNDPCPCGSGKKFKKCCGR